MRSSHKWCLDTRRRYIAEAWKVVPTLAPEAAAERVAFAILTANQPLTRSVQALEWWRGERPEPPPGMYSQQLQAAKEVFPGHGPALERREEEGETPYQHRIRLAISVPGLGLTKASFACALMEPITSPLACLDRHILRLLDVNKPPGTVTQYRALERRIQDRARRVGLPGFLTQWALWDWQRAASRNRSPSVTPHGFFAT